VGVVKGADRAGWVGGGGAGSDVAETPAVAALRVTVEGVGAFDVP